jgi:hypothetical protein
MKAQKLMIIAITTSLLLVGNFFTQASNTEDGLNKKVKKYINARMEYPENDNDISGFVIVEYAVDTAGYIAINAINASHSALKDHVENSINNLTNYPKAETRDTSFICKYVFVSQEEYNAPKKSSGMKGIIGINEFTAEK